MTRFDYFVVFAEMRTGSNFLEANLNAVPGIVCHGEAFNPSFIGFPNRTEVLGITREERDAEPQRLVSAVRDEPGVLAGFRFFNDHDPRVLDGLLADPRCAKIVLTRNPVESYVSRRIAAATGQWKLTNVKHARASRIRFDRGEFERHLDALQAFQLRILRALQVSGQTAFYLDYEDLQEVEVMNGLAAWLGVEGRLEGLDKKLKKQNPEPLEARVENYEEMVGALSRLDRFDLGRTPVFEPRRGPAVPSYVAAPEAGLLYMPVRSGPEAAVRDWLSALDDGAPVQDGMNQGTLRKWRLAHPRHRSFTVLRHPLARAHAAFCDRILATGQGSYPEIRKSLMQVFKLPLPKGPDAEGYDLSTHRAAYLGFLGFVKANLGGQTNLRVDPAWASQLTIVQGWAQLAPPDLMLREEGLAEALARLAEGSGRTAPRLGETDPHARVLEAIHDPELEAAGREAYGRDYEVFGFGNWRA